MILQLLSILDFLAGINLILLRFGIFKYSAWFFAIYLIFKGFIFFGDMGTIVDVAGAIFIILAIFGIFPFFTWLFVAWLMHKIFVSLA